MSDANFAKVEQANTIKLAAAKVKYDEQVQSNKASTGVSAMEKAVFIGPGKKKQIQQYAVDDAPDFDYSPCPSGDVDLPPPAPKRRGRPSKKSDLSKSRGATAAICNDSVVSIHPTAGSSSSSSTIKQRPRGIVNNRMSSHS